MASGLVALGIARLCLEDFTRPLLEATGDAAIRAAAVRFTMALLGADFTALFIADPNAGELRLESGLGWAPRVVGAVAEPLYAESFAGYAFVQKTAIHSDDLVHERRFPVPGYLRDHGVRAGIVVPFGVRREPIGVLGAYYREDHRFSDEESRVVAAVAHGTALALDKVRVSSESMQADKLTALGTLLSGMAHELNNPLSTIQLSVQLMKRSSDLTAPMRKRLDAMEEECDRASRIIRDLLVFARRLPPERRRVDVNELTRRTLALQAPDFERAEIRVVSELAPAPPILADPHQLQQVLLNLFTNATFAMRAHGGGVLTVRSALEGAEVVIRVEDDGPGIAPEHLGRIFDPFFTTKPAGEGTGLGLSLSIGIVEAHGGRMTVENLPGRGARFAVRLPVGEDAAPDPPALARGTTTARQASVLIVDDEPRLNETLGEVLTALGHRVEPAMTGAQAIERLGAVDYDVVMLDLRLPDIDGRGIWEWLGAHRPAICGRVIFMSGDTVSPETRRFLESTGRPVLTKPLAIERVRAMVDDTRPLNMGAPQHRTPKPPSGTDLQGVSASSSWTARTTRFGSAGFRIATVAPSSRA